MNTWLKNKNIIWYSKLTFLIGEVNVFKKK